MKLKTETAVAEYIQEAISEWEDTRFDSGDEDFVEVGTLADSMFLTKDEGLVFTDHTGNVYTVTVTRYANGETETEEEE